MIKDKIKQSNNFLFDFDKNTEFQIIIYDNLYRSDPFIFDTSTT